MTVPLIETAPAGELALTLEKLGDALEALVHGVELFGEIAAGLVVDLPFDDERRRPLLDLMLGSRLFVGAVGAVVEECRP